MQQIMGASGLMDASPVNMPTFSVPSWAQRSKNFSETRALMGALYHDRPPEASTERWAHRATRLLPEPVGVATMTWSPAKTASTASSCAG